MDRAGEVEQADPRRWYILGLLAFAELLGMSVWLAANAVAPEIRESLGLSAPQSVWLTTVVQLGFVLGTALAAVLNLADVWSSRSYFVGSALLAAGANAALLLAPSYAWALLCRLGTGFFLAGVYPPGMKMVATWFRSSRGFAIGTLVGALTLGKAAPYLLGAFPGIEARDVILASSAAAGLAALLVWAFYHDGPHPFPRRPFSWGLVGVVVRDRPTRLATAGYLGHMWELYAMWTAVGLFFTDYFSRAGDPTPYAPARVMAFATIAAGALGSVVAGVWADRVGRERVANWAMALSAACALSLGWMGAFPFVWVAAVALLWGFTVVADSAQFSALVTEVAPPHAAGTALTLQTSAGFLLTMVTVQGTPLLAQRAGWGPAFGILSIGPLLGIWAMLRLSALRATGSRAP